MNDTTTEKTKSALVARIEQLEQARSRTKPSRSIKKLTRTQITTDPEVFQPRQTKELNEHHISNLVDGLKRSPGKVLDPITVIEIEGKFFVVDGHHRLEAYRRVREVTKVAVKPFLGTVKEAIASGGTENGKARLVMGQVERSELAWRYVTMGCVWTKKQTATMAQVSESLVAIMRRKWKEAGHPNPEERKPWWQVREGIEEDLNADERETWVEEQAKQMAERLGKALGHHLQKNPEISAKALVICLGHKTQDVMEFMAQEEGIEMPYSDEFEEEGAF